MRRMRFTSGNWERFVRHGKKTTIRLRQKPDGVYEAVTGNYCSPVILGRIRVAGSRKKLVCELDEQDARNDGFAALDDLLCELRRLNGSLRDDAEIWIHEIVTLPKFREGVTR